MAEPGRWRGWLRRRRVEQGGPGRHAAPETPAPPATQPEPVVRAADRTDPWRPIAGEFALRLLTLTWEAVHHIGEAEFREQDAERRQILFRIDHSVTRVRRLAENLRVLTGEPLDDPDQQVTSLHDVTHAAGAAVEHYERLHFGPIADLAVTATAADDVIRILTELIDNADRYSPPTEPVTIAAHLTGDGDVVIRVEDTGIGLNPAHLPWIERLLTDGPGDGELQPAHLGLAVAAVLTHRHGSLRVRLVPRQPRGTVAMLLIGADLLCESPRVAPDESPAEKPQPAPNGRNHRNDVTMVLPAMPKPMPRRVPASVRANGATLPPPPPASTATHETTWHDDAAAFNAGVDAARAQQESPPGIMEAEGPQ
ncbi:Adaptive-response sensory-kinase sasA [Actinoplanes sp. SE50]|uniref:sensor histidine kinase n=1 Tax=unclassified Actinoplanes TaxID=2626549 RepID=UPI00023ED31D|nr:MULTISPECIES: ATP-binding protein [unclassified Actinoplanes]AEV87839.1 Adaptive-response sensory-kinase sasA [Actinoplanes sp. SE50/110]ATO86241.1 Adaptive-response sensory-kinase sasA [Actinoplanes sp. SE50]SLM03656.1 Sensor histidine kinase [Actinoplanes sp. SE50/110]